MKLNLLIVGLGLIGSSLALCLKKQQPTLTIYGFDQRKEYEAIALQKGMIDATAASIEAIAPTADYIFLCTPVSATLKQLSVLSQLPLKQNVLITDVGSTKQEIVALAEKLNLQGFIGGHPMAGSHKSGVTAAQERLFENAYYILTPNKATQTQQISELSRLLAATHATFITMSAAEHDQITGMLSHLPHIIAAGLVNQSHRFNERFPRASQLAAGGFRDITRIASSDPAMWTDILLSNKDPLLALLTSWQAEMKQVEDWLQAGDYQAIRTFLKMPKQRAAN